MFVRRWIPVILVSSLALVSLACGGGDEGGGGTGPESPTIAFTAPGDGDTVSGTVTLTVTTTHAESVKFLVDDVTLAESTAPPHVAVWQTRDSGDGSHRIRAVATGTGGTAEDAVSVTVDNTAVVVEVDPTLVEVTLGSSRNFTATVTGTADTAVSWSVDQGASAGSISPTGQYTAPGVMPTGGTATIRATSVADPTKSGAAAVTLIEPNPGPGTRDAALVEAFTGTRTAAALGLSGVETAAQAVFEASAANGDQLTTTGTLTQVDAENFSWAAVPTDKLVIQFLDGARLELVIEEFAGDFSDWETFRDFHSSLVFTATAEGIFSLRIRSQSGTPQAGTIFAAAGTTGFERTMTGTLRIAGTDVLVDITSTGEVSADFSGGNVDYRSTEATSGTMNSANASITVNEAYEYIFLSVTSAVEQTKRANRSTARVGDDTYVFQDVWVQTTCRDNQVTETEFWQATGELLRNGSRVGSVRFDAPPVAGTVCSAPRPVVQLADGTVVPL